MNLKTEEFLLIALAVIILVGISIVIHPSITGYITYEFSDFIPNEDIVIDNGIQLKQHSYTTEWTIEETSYYSLIFAEKHGVDKLEKLAELDNKKVELEKNHLLKIRFDNNLENNDILNLYIDSNKATLVNICNFNAEDSCDNETLYASLDYQGQQGNYPLILSLAEPTSEFAIDTVDKKLSINYINASHLDVIQHSNTTYYYNSAEVETETIQPEDLLSWDLFSAEYTSNNQTLNFYYKTDQNYIEFISPYNFSVINSSSLKFKIALHSDNTTTPIIHNLTIKYTEVPCAENWSCTDWSECINNTQIRICTDLDSCNTIENKPVEIQECTIETNPDNSQSSSSGSSSVTRFSSSPAKTTETAEASNPIGSQTITQQIEFPKETSTEVVELQEIKETPVRLYGNILLFSLLSILSYIYYHKRIKDSRMI